MRPKFHRITIRGCGRSPSEIVPRSNVTAKEIPRIIYVGSTKKDPSAFCRRSAGLVSNTPLFFCFNRLLASRSRTSGRTYGCAQAWCESGTAGETRLTVCQRRNRTLGSSVAKRCTHSICRRAACTVSCPNGRSRGLGGKIAVGQVLIATRCLRVRSGAGP